MTTSLSAIDLFSGAGGLSLGLTLAGVDVRLAVDSWHLAVETHAKNLGHPVVSADISRLSGIDVLRMAGVRFGELDLLVGGPPCQGFSVQRIGSDADPRNSLIMEYARLVEETRPRIFLMENVPGLIGKRGQSLVSRFETRLAQVGYTMNKWLVDAVDFGVPQRRRRVLLIGQRAGQNAFELTTPSCDLRTVRDTIGDLPPPAPPGSETGPDPLHVESRLSPLNRKRIALIPPGGGFEDLPQELRAPCHRSGAARIGHRNVYGRLHPEQPSATITARFDSFTRGQFGHPWENRNLTLREGARLQSFPDWFVFFGNREEVAAQIGNSVPPVMAKELGRQLLEQTVIPLRPAV